MSGRKKKFRVELVVLRGGKETILSKEYNTKSESNAQALALTLVGAVRVKSIEEIIVGARHAVPAP